MPYNSSTYVKKLFDPSASSSFKLSRSKIDLFVKCPRCFYLDRRLGISQPQGPSFTLNNAVDKLLKKEFDFYRAQQLPHPLMQEYDIDAIPFMHDLLDLWRENFKGIQYHHPATNFIITGAIDDLWINPKGEIIIVDYKATSKPGEISLDDPWKEAYKRQMEIYQWLFRQNGFQVNPTGYFVYCNGIGDKNLFDNKLEFIVKILPYTGNDSWVDTTIKKAFDCLSNNQPPDYSPDCDFCKYNQENAKIKTNSIKLDNQRTLSKPVTRRFKRKKMLINQPNLFDYNT